jgi:uncharacterized membrane protein
MRMKVIGGSFGVQGRAFIKNQRLYIKASEKLFYEADQVAHIDTRTESERRFQVVTAIIGGIALCIVLGVFFSVIGVLVGVAVAIAGSFYTERRAIADVEFKDGKRVTLEGSPKGINRLLQF